jgi:hypothetical protein
LKKYYILQYLLIINPLTRNTARDTRNTARDTRNRPRHPQPPDYCVIPDVRHQNHVTTQHMK